MLWVALSLQTMALTHLLWAYLISKQFVNLLNGASFHFVCGVVCAVVDWFAYLLEFGRNSCVFIRLVPHHLLVVGDPKVFLQRLYQKAGRCCNLCTSCDFPSVDYSHNSNTMTHGSWVGKYYHNGTYSSSLFLDVVTTCPYHVFHLINLTKSLLLLRDTAHLVGKTHMWWWSIYRVDFHLLSVAQISWWSLLWSKVRCCWELFRPINCWIWKDFGDVSN